MDLFNNILVSNNNISYIDVGIGETVVVLLHGFGEDATIWKHQINLLQIKYRIIAPNITGTGNSSLINENNVSIDDYAIWLNLLVENIFPNNNQKIVLLGHSMGGYITLSFAKLFPKKLIGFGLIHSTAFADNEEKKQVRLRGMEALENYGSFAFLKNTTPNLFSSEFKKNNWQQVEDLISNCKTIAVAALQQYYVAMMNRENTTNVLQNANVPVLFIIGTEDVAAPMQDVLQQCHLPKQTSINILKNVGHIGMLEAPEEMNICIDNFLKLLD